ncbi:MAG: hypothetical protein LBK99_16440 [Opitutaceae bacterium]|jgi:hypothetical protein|nr:hypothetical protein [Opitutaceae bacterium]
MKTKSWQLHSVFASGKVDKDSGIIRDVSIITGGLTARGHDLDVDETTLAQMLECCTARGQVPVKENHKSGVEAVTGYLTNFRIDGNKLKGDWHLLGSHPRRDQYLETAERMPGGVGLSASFIGPEKPGKGRDGRAKARCTEVLSVDLVPTPAANPDGLFSAKVDTSRGGMEPDPVNPDKKEPTLADVMATLGKINERLDAQEQFNQSVTQALNPPSLEDLSQMSPEQLADIGLSPEDVQQALAEAGGGDEPAPGGDKGEDDPRDKALAALQKTVTELTARLDKQATDAEQAELEHHFETVEKTIDQLKAENDALKEAMKAGGTTPVTPQTGSDIVHFGGSADGKFEKAIELAMKDGKTPRHVAFSTVQKTDPAAYQDYLKRIGVTK